MITNIALVAGRIGAAANLSKVASVAVRIASNKAVRFAAEIAAVGVAIDVAVDTISSTKEWRSRIDNYTNKRASKARLRKAAHEVDKAKASPWSSTYDESHKVRRPRRPFKVFVKDAAKTTGILLVVGSTVCIHGVRKAWRASIKGVRKTSRAVYGVVKYVFFSAMRTLLGIPLLFGVGLAVILVIAIWAVNVAITAISLLFFPSKAVKIVDFGAKLSRKIFTILVVAPNKAGNWFKLGYFDVFTPRSQRPSTMHNDVLFDGLVDRMVKTAEEAEVIQFPNEGTYPTTIVYDSSIGRDEASPIEGPHQFENAGHPVNRQARREAERARRAAERRQESHAKR